MLFGYKAANKVRINVTLRSRLLWPPYLEQILIRSFGFLWEVRMILFCKNGEMLKFKKGKNFEELFFGIVGEKL